MKRATAKQIEYCQELVKLSGSTAKIDFDNLTAAQAHKLIREINSKLKRHGWSWRGKLNLVFGGTRK
jgi:hypothetical protein